MTYSTAQKNEAARLLAGELAGLHYRMARAMVTAEQGGNNNTLGVTVGGVLQKYPSMRAGIKAAANIIRTSPLYADFRASLNGGTHREQATAWVRSPWRLGAGGLKKAGGQDAYYTRIIFKQLRLVPPKPPA